MKPPSQYKQTQPGCQASQSAGDRSPLPISIGIGIVATSAVLALGSLALAYLSTHPPRVPVRRPRPKDELEIEDVSFPSRDGVKLSGWFVESPGAQGGVILCHGHPFNRTEMIPWARVLSKVGFHVLLFDFRALGESEGDLCSIGFHEVGDLLGAVDYFTARPEMEGLPLGLYGISMGGAVCLMAAAQDTRIAAVATHGAYASLDSAIAQRGRLLLGPLGPALSASTTWWGRRWIPEDPCNVAPVNVVNQIAPRPVLLFHGKNDMTISPKDAQALYQAAAEPKTLRVVPRSWHVFIHPNERPDYERELIAFFKNNLRQD